MGRVRFPVCNIAGVDPEEIEAIVASRSNGTSARKDAASFLQKLAQEQEADEDAAAKLIEEQLSRELDQQEGEEKKQSVAEYWQTRVNALKTTGDLDNKDYEILSALSTLSFGDKQGQIRPDPELSRWDIYHLLTQAPLGQDPIRCWITGIIPFNVLERNYESLWFNWYPRERREERLNEIFSEKAHQLFDFISNVKPLSFKEWSRIIKCLNRMANC